MGSPRILFVEGQGFVPHRAVPTQRGADPHAASQAVPGSEGANRWVMWRLLSGNNRELGRSAEAFSHLDEAVAAIMRVRGGLRHLSPTIVQELRPSSWAWTLALNGIAVARSARSYQRLRDCHFSVAGFSDALPLAAVLTDPSRVVRQRRNHEAAIEPIDGAALDVR